MKKFRIYDKEYGRYVESPDYRWFLSRSGQIYNSEIDEWFTPGERYVIEWSSGFVLSNSTELYEGDVIHKNGCHIVWDKDILCWCFKHVGDEFLTPLYYGETFNDIHRTYGTIHDFKINTDV